MRSDSGIDVLIIDGEGSGGMAHYAHNLTGGLNGYCRATLYTISPDDGLDHSGFLARLLERSYTGQRLRRNYNSNRYRRIARKILDTLAPSVVHITSRVASMNGLIDELTKNNVPVVATIHDPLPHQEHRTLWGHAQTFVFEKWITPKTLAKCQAIHVHSELHARQLKKHRQIIKAERVYIVQHGGGLTPDIANGLQAPPEIEISVNAEQTALFFGRIEPYKGIDLLLKAMKIVVAENPHFRLIIAGAGQLPDIPEDLLPHLIIINRFIGDEEIRTIFNSSAFAILPYLAATQTGVIPMASGFSKPAIATRVGALPELIKHQETGLVVDPNNADALAGAILTMLNAPGRTALMGQAAHDFMTNNFSWSAVSKHHITQYQNLMQVGVRHRHDD